MSSPHEPVSPDDIAPLFERCGIDPSAPCGLAVSGGSDSTALMILFAEWLRQRAIDPGSHVVLTVDHGLRPGASAEARDVASRARSLGFHHAILVWEGAKPRTGLQAAARVARYRLMGDYLRVHGANVLLTGHTQNDQAETLLMRLARGSGLDGLAGVAAQVDFADLGLGEPAFAGLRIARPLLDMPRERLRATLRARGISWTEDPSNLATEFERPRLRAARPALDALGLTDAMVALSARRLRRARSALEHMVDDLCRPDAGVVAADACGYVVIDLVRLRQAEVEIALRLLGRAIAAAGGSEDPIPLAKLETVAEILHDRAAKLGRWTLSRTIITANKDQVTLEREPGREALPTLELAPGAQARWDGRFLVSLAAGEARAVEVHALGETAARELHRQGAVTTHAPISAMALVPSFWSDCRLVAVPSLGYWSGAGWRCAVQSRFIWPDAVPSTAGKV